MRTLTFLAFIAFWAVIATLLLLHALEPTGQPQSGHTDAETQPADTPRAAEEARRYSIDEVAQHAAPDDCWMAIEGRVYDLTAYLPRHPAPDDVLHQWCGREATRGMRSKGMDRDHSARAWRMLERFRIGLLVNPDSPTPAKSG